MRNGHDELYERRFLRCRRICERRYMDAEIRLDQNRRSGADRRTRGERRVFETNIPFSLNDNTNILSREEIRALLNPYSVMDD